MELLILLVVTILNMICVKMKDHTSGGFVDKSRWNYQVQFEALQCHGQKDLHYKNAHNPTLIRLILHKQEVYHFVQIYTTA